MIIYLSVRQEFNKYAAMAQEVERRLGKAEVTGSNPVSSFTKSRFQYLTGIFFAFNPFLPECQK